MDATSWAFVIGAIVVLVALSGVFQIINRFFWAFTIAAAVMLYFHFQNNPGEAAMGYAALFGGHALKRPFARFFSGFG